MPRKSSKKSHPEISAFYKEEFLKHKARLEMQQRVLLRQGAERYRGGAGQDH